MLGLEICTRPMNDLDLNIEIRSSSNKADENPINLDILISTCIKRHYSPDDFCTLVLEYDRSYPVTTNEFINAKFETSHTSIWIDYALALMLSDISRKRLGLDSVFQVLNSIDVEVQVDLIQGIIDDRDRLRSLGQQLFDVQGREFFQNFSEYALTAPQDQVLTKTIMYFVGSIIEVVIELNTKTAADRLVIPPRFVEAVYEYETKLLKNYPELAYLLPYIDELLEKHFEETKKTPRATSTGKSSIKIEKLIWLSKAIEKQSTASKSFLQALESMLKEELEISGTRRHSSDLKLLISSLITTAMESFCISAANGVATNILLRWKLFIEKQLPLLILQLKINNGKDIHKFYSDPETLGVAEDVFVNSNVAFSEPVQAAIIEAISYLDARVVKILKLFASDDLNSRNKNLISGSKSQNLDYIKVLQTNDDDDIFSSFPSTVVDMRHDFLKSCFTLKLIKVEDFVTCLKEDAKAEVRLLTTDDRVKDINTGEFADDLRLYIDTIFLNGNPEFESVTNSNITRFLTQIPGFEGTRQFEISMVLYQTIANLIANKKNVFLRQLSLGLLLSLSSLDVIVFYIGPLNLVKPLINYLDIWQNDEEDMNFQDTYTDFSCLYLLLFFIVSRYKLQVADLYQLTEHRNLYSFCIDNLSNFGSYNNYVTSCPESVVTDELINEWINALFDSSSGISDELMNKTSVKQCFILIPKIFQQSFIAYQENCLDFDVFKGGTEYFFQQFLIVPLLGVFSWLESYLWSPQDPKLIEPILKVINFLLVPMVNEEAKVIHGLILKIACPWLFQTLKEYNLNSRMTQIFENVILSNDYCLNQTLTASVRPFDNGSILSHYNNKSIPTFKTLENQLISLVTWTVSNRHKTLIIPQYDPLLVLFMAQSVGESRLLEFFVDEILLFEQVAQGTNLKSSVGKALKDFLEIDKAVLDVISLLIVAYTNWHNLQKSNPPKVDFGESELMQIKDTVALNETTDSSKEEPYPEIYRLVILANNSKTIRQGMKKKKVTDIKVDCLMKLVKNIRVILDKEKY